MTSNLGACEMSALSSPKLGFNAARRASPVETAGELASKMSKSAVEAARRKFTPEFMNRIDKVAVFRPLGKSELRCILDLELRQVQQRILHTPVGKPFVFRTTDATKMFLLAEGTDMRYGARHLKRTIARLLVQPLSNLMASNQINAGDCIELDFDDEAQKLSFAKIDQGLSSQAMANLAENGVSMQVAAAKAA